MTKQERIALSQKGITILREQWDARAEMYKIVKYNLFGKGWIRFGKGWYYTREDGRNAAKRIASESPKIYAYDE